MQPLFKYCVALLTVLTLAPAAHALDQQIQAAWPSLDPARLAVPAEDIRSGGPPKDGIPSIDHPVFTRIDDTQLMLEDKEPVLLLTHGQVTKIYPLRILTWHEIVNDEIDGLPVAVTYCPLCNSAMVFVRRVQGQVLEFGVSGLLRNSDMIMYDRQTESWWQQFTATAIAGAHVGQSLEIVPSALVSWSRARTRAPDALVLARPATMDRPYGRNPYGGYDTAPRPFLYQGPYPDGIEPMAYEVRVGAQAWPVRRIVDAGGTLETADYVIQWEPGMRSALDSPDFAQGREIGMITVTRADNRTVSVAHEVTFAFVFQAFHPEGTLYLTD